MPHEAHGRWLRRQGDAHGHHLLGGGARGAPPAAAGAHQLGQGRGHVDHRHPAPLLRQVPRRGGPRRPAAGARPGAVLQRRLLDGPHRAYHRPSALPQRQLLQDPECARQGLHVPDEHGFEHGLPRVRRPPRFDRGGGLAGASGDGAEDAARGGPREELVRLRGRQDPLLPDPRALPRPAHVERARGELRARRPRGRNRAVQRGEPVAETRHRAAPDQVRHQLHC
mmetsp:Transcript_28532/g.71695  ORF Transcript_28532/g.71695 Transcript_28532/m.71695 type:complete len:225 (+) Transcript_28532:2694-3368(+)